MRAWLRMAILGALLSAPGCAYQQAMTKGDSLAAAGDWEAAFTAYEEAVQTKPDSEEAQIARQRAKDHAVEAAIDAASKALVGGDYEAVLEELAKVAAFDNDRPEVFDLRNETQRKMADDYARLWEMGEPRHAYTMAARTKKLFPKAEHLPEALETLRAHYTEQAEAQLEEEKYEDAMASIGQILEYEPDRQADVAPVEQRIRSAWAKAIVVDAKDLDRQRKHGAAALTYARAYEIAGRSGDLEEARRIGKDLAAKAGFTYDLRLSGELSRSAAMKEWLAAELGKTKDAEPVTSRASLTARITVNTRKCAEEDEVTKATKDFVSGQIEVDNPDWHDLTDQIARAREAEATAIERAEEMFPEVEGSESALAVLDAKIATAQKAHDGAQSQLSMSATQFESAKARQAELQTELTQQQTSGAMPGTIETTEARLAESKKRVAEWEEQVGGLQATFDTAKAELDALNVERGPLGEALTRLKSGYEAVVKDRTDNAALASQLSSKLAMTDKTLMQDVIETLEYDIHDYKRTCLGRVTATMQMRWRESETSMEYTPVNKSEDRSHIGHVKAEITEDKKEFPESDDAMLAKGDEETRKAVYDWISKLVGEFYSDRVTDVTVALSQDPVVGSTDMLSLYLGASSRLEETTVGTFEAHAKQHFGVEKLELLKSGATSTDM